MVSSEYIESSLRSLLRAKPQRAKRAWLRVSLQACAVGAQVHRAAVAGATRNARRCGWRCTGCPSFGGQRTVAVSEPHRQKFIGNPVHEAAIFAFGRSGGRGGSACLKVGAGCPSFGGQRTSGSPLGWGCAFSLGSRTLVAMNATASYRSSAKTAPLNQASNHSIERTYNGEAQLRVSSWSAAPLSAAHVER